MPSARHTYSITKRRLSARHRQVTLRETYLVANLQLPALRARHRNGRQELRRSTLSCRPQRCPHARLRRSLRRQHPAISTALAIALSAAALSSANFWPYASTESPAAAEAAFST